MADLPRYALDVVGYAKAKAEADAKRALAKVAAEKAKSETKTESKSVTETKEEVAAATAEASAPVIVEHDERVETVPPQEETPLEALASSSSMPEVLRPPAEPMRVSSRVHTIESQVPPVPDPSSMPEVSMRSSAAPIPGGAHPREADKETLMDMRPPVVRDSRPSPTPSADPDSRNAYVPESKEETAVITSSPPKDAALETQPKPSSRLSRQDMIALACGSVMLLATAILYFID